MRITPFAHCTAALSLIAAAPALAAELGSGFTVNGGATLVSDYRFRGISQTDRRFAVQGSFTLGHSSGLYATIWASSVDDYVYGGASDQEIDFILGYRRSFGGTTLDVGLLYYFYPGASALTPTASDFFEPYVSVSHSFGPVTAKLTANYAPRQSALSIGVGDRDNLYLASDLSASLGNGFAAAAHLGHSFGPSYLTIGDGYTDWTLGVSYATGPLTLGVQYVDTDGAFITPSGRNASGAGLVGTLGVAF